MTSQKHSKKAEHGHGAHHNFHLTHSKALAHKHVHFLQRAAPCASKSETETGVPAAITLAQSILESAWGEHHIGDANNYFGIKAHTVHNKIIHGSIATGYVNRSTQEHIKKTGKDKTVIAHFRSYADMEGSFRDHGQFLRDNARYNAAFDAYARTRNADDFARGLQAAGYATDPNYAAKLISIMKKHNLYIYNSPSSPNKISVP